MVAFSHKLQRGSVSPWVIAITCALALATAMGIGRFAFTPLLPMMLADGVVDLPGASWLASANYLGYLVGALLCTFQPLIWSRFKTWPNVAATTWLRGGLVATCVLTLGMALHVPALWPWLRFAAGVASAFVFVFTSGWCLARLAERNASNLGGVMFTGPGAGIAISGVLASGMVALQWKAAAGWLIFGVLACVLTAMTWRTFGMNLGMKLAKPAPLTTDSATPTHHVQTSFASRWHMFWLAIAYGLDGLGYIITATFLPVIARQVMPGSAWLDLFWPLFGLAVIVGALISTRISLKGDLRYILAASYIMQAVGVIITVWLPTPLGFALGSLLLGLPFTAITFFAMQEVRRLKPNNVASYTGLLTAVYGLGQIAGPPLAAWLLSRSATVGQGFNVALEIAAASLVLGALMFVGLAKVYPKRGASQ
ncbi:MAG: YbfB/YjiJ family MFS transporter [Polaromonas sp.]